jgi:uncharacterized protein (TIGR03083 family)
LETTVNPLPPIDVRDRFAGERAALLDLLASLSAAEWAAPTVCAGWSVKDVALHLLGDDVGRLAAGRDNSPNPAFWIDPELDPWTGLVAAIDRQNELWVETTRRLSPRLVIDLLRLTGEQTEDYFRQLDVEAVRGAVDWAGPDPAPVWLDLAREYTERWVHQQHIRDAVARPGLKEPEWLHPVLATFVYGLLRSLAGIEAGEGTVARLTITGEAGGDWVAVRRDGGWHLGTDYAGVAAATVALDQETAWRLFTKGISKDEARARAMTTGDPALAGRVLDTVSILA